MAVIWFVLRSELRNRWRSWLTLAMLVAVVGGLVLAAAVAGRRTATAFPRFLAQYGYDTFVYSGQPIPAIEKLPGVKSVIDVKIPASGTPECGCKRYLSGNDFAIFEVAPAQLPHFAKLVSGRMPVDSSANEVLASFGLQHDYGVEVGSVLRVPIYTAAQAEQNATGPATGPTVDLHVVGIEANENDFPSLGTPSYEVLATPAFARAVNPQTLVFSAYTVRLRHGAADLPRFDAAVRALGAQGQGAQLLASAVISAIHPQAVGWWLLAGLTGMGGLLVVAQALSREAIVERETYRTLGAVGLEHRQLAVLGILRALVIAVMGAAGSFLLAFLLSPLTPLGEARIAEPSSGLYLDGLVLGVGVLIVVVVVGLLGIWPAVREARTLRRRSVEVSLPRSAALSTILSSARVPVTAGIGVRRALERGQGASAVPVGTALLGSILAVAALCGTVVFGTSLSHLLATPRLYGQSFQLWFNNLNGPGPAQANEITSQLEDNRNVTAITLGTGSGSVKINGVATDAIAGQAIRGKVLVSSVNGRLPTGPREVALGVKTMQETKARVGSIVRVSIPQSQGGDANSTFRVVGTASYPPDFGAVGLNVGAIFTIPGLIDAQCQVPASAAQCRSAIEQRNNYVVLVGVRNDAAGRATVNRLPRENPDTAIIPETPSNLVSFGQAVNFPLILGIVLTLFGAATLVHVLVVSLARRRRDVALLKALGFVRHQAGAVVAWQATSVALVGTVIGVPVGAALGQLVWRAFATNLGVVPEPVIPVLAALVLAVGVIVVANLLSLGAAFASARSRPALVLRQE